MSATSAMDQPTAAPCVFLCEEEWEIPLEKELDALGFGEIRTTAPGWVRAALPCGADLGALNVAFAGQCLFDAQSIIAESISQWSRQAAERILSLWRDHDGPWRLHVFNRYADSDLSGYRRATLVRQSLLDELKKAQRRLWRGLHDETSPGWRHDEALVQMALRSPTEGYLSLTPPGLPQTMHRVVSRYPAGVVDVPAQLQAPSRAFRKLAEVELRMDRPVMPGESCVDLGSSPGSWAWWALQRGAEVIAIDRSPLRNDLMQHARLSFVRADAFKYAPPATVDWLLSDIIAFPDRILRLLDDWLSRGWCRRFCVTIKFRGAEEYPILMDFRALLNEKCADYTLRRLTHNRNEVTAYGMVRSESHVAVGC